jgi:hypothetical protein
MLMPVVSQDFCPSNLWLWLSFALISKEMNTNLQMEIYCCMKHGHESLPTRITNLQPDLKLAVLHYLEMLTKTCRDIYHT